MVKNIHPSKFEVSSADRTFIKSHSPACVWLTGLSASGKSTIANSLEHELNERGIHTYILDGDNIRNDLSSDLQFDVSSREENIRRATAVAKLFVDAGLVVICAFITPTQTLRKQIRNKFNPHQFFQIFIDTPLEIAEQRDPKGLYRKARSGELKLFTGIDSPFDPPDDSELVVDTTQYSPSECASQILNLLLREGIIS